MKSLTGGLATVLLMGCVALGETFPVPSKDYAMPVIKVPAGGFDPDILKDLDGPSTNSGPGETNSTGGAVATSVELSGNEVQCATLIHAGNKQSKCFANQFLVDLSKNANVRTQPQFVPVRMDAKEMFQYPFAVLSGEGDFTLTESERANLRRYLENGGFLLASAGCSSKPWADSFKKELKNLFPARAMEKLSPEHAIFHTVYDIKDSHYKVGKDRFPDLFGVEFDGRIALIFSPDGLNDTGNAGKDCCCCGGNEVKAARQINVNVLAYSLTH
jgi:hypothetical protein